LEKGIKMKKVIFTKEAPKAIGPYSQAILSKDTLYCSGQIALNKKGNFIAKNIEEETIQIIKNISEVLKEANMNLSNIVKTTIFLKNMDDFSLVNSIYEKSFTLCPPARETVEVSALPKNANIEITVIAVL
jgi:2-iminobutanoate/2-iminopropanoate deaminase|tara:strand:+ start:367 stop:759 length:393 start_codon:yes stop_codon:yes gene_type:complete